MSQRKKNSTDKVMFIGIFMIIIGVVGAFCIGPIGRLITAVSAYLVGEIYILLPICLIILGIYTLYLKKIPNRLTPRILGLMLVLIGITMLLYKETAAQIDNTRDFIKLVFDKSSNVFQILDNTSKNIAFSGIGGGIVGGIFMWLSMNLFGLVGTKIIYWIFIIFGVGLFTGVSILDIVKGVVDRGKVLTPPKDKVAPNKEEIMKEKDTLLPEGEVMINDNDNRRIIERPSEKKTESPKLDKDKLIDHTNKKYKLPTIDIFDKPRKQNVDNGTGIDDNIKKLEKELQGFNITGKVVAVTVGPAYTQYEMALKPGTKLSKLEDISKELGVALSKSNSRIEAPIPGKSTIGIEIENNEHITVYIKEIMESIPNDEKTNKKKLLVALGKDVKGETKLMEIDKTPHLLIAGAKDTGKTVLINCILASILTRTKPDEVKLMLIDPIKDEKSLCMYNGVPHLLRPVITDPKKASVALQLVVQEMEHRYDIFEHEGVKNIDSYNEKVERENEKRKEEDQIKKMPYIVVVIDELASLMMINGNEIEDCILRITELSRIAGVHLIITTQRTEKNVVTDLIGDRIPSRITFYLKTKKESENIIDVGGAEKLLGRGDMLYLPQGDNSPIRIQGAWICEEEIHRIIDYVCGQQKAQYDARFENVDSEKTMDLGYISGIEANDDVDEEYDEPMYNEIVDFVVQTGKASASILQRRFKLGYNRAARVIDLLEERGIIGPATGNSKPREVLVKYGDDDSDDRDVI